MANIIAGRKATGKFFYQYGFGEKLSSVPQKRLTEIICGLAMKGNQSRTTDFAELNQGYRTTYGHFLSKGKWDEEKVSQQQQAQALRKADELAGAKCAPIYPSLGDTVIEKKKPSSRATRPMEGTGWHYSHLEGKQVYGYQVFGANISTGDFSLCYCLRRCCPENGSKIDMAVQLLDTLPETDAHIILQMDSWYTCKALWDKALEKNITLIGAMKTTVIFTLTATAKAPRITPPCSQTANTTLLQWAVTSIGFIAMKGRSTESIRLLSCSPIPKTRSAARKRCACSFALILPFLMGKFFLIIPTDGKLRSCSSSKKCIWVSNPLWSVPLKPSTACLLSFLWLIFSLWSCLISPCLYLPLFVVLGPFCAVFNFAHLELYN